MISILQIRYEAGGFYLREAQPVALPSHFNINTAYIQKKNSVQTKKNVVYFPAEDMYTKDRQSETNDHLQVHERGEAVVVLELQIQPRVHHVLGVKGRHARPAHHVLHWWRPWHVHEERVGEERQTPTGFHRRRLRSHAVDAKQSVKLFEDRQCCLVLDWGVTVQVQQVSGRWVKNEGAIGGGWGG